MLGLLRFQILDSLFFLNSASLKRAVPASIEFVDIAGLVKGASQGEGLGNKFLWHIRQVDSILQVVCSFEDNDIVLVNGKVDPKTDIDVINLKLVFSDLDQVSYDNFVAVGSLAAAREKGLLRSEGKDYVVQGDVIPLRFNV
ncbi:uncharacterized protein LOC111276037 isoform X1 [Durio zibethinus]|uniref:Uncharacterized protein LOC111276037 isoform X1 n=1 Tax=Durio zibethinus TaxID=66656 RepID=A0A6P5WNP0_DURZI|nr:uncharacterized protein LOC111276037 isoform X1 [Durio zibethinus]